MLPKIFIISSSACVIKCFVPVLYVLPGSDMSTSLFPDFPEKLSLKLSKISCKLFLSSLRDLPTCPFCSLETVFISSKSSLSAPLRLRYFILNCSRISPEVIFFASSAASFFIFRIFSNITAFKLLRQVMGN